jgi:hypothetical protein
MNFTKRPSGKKRHQPPTNPLVRKALNTDESERISSCCQVIAQATSSLEWSTSNNSKDNQVLPLRTPDDEASSTSSWLRPSPDDRPSEKEVKSVLLDIKSFVINSPKLRKAIGHTTKVIPTVVSLVDALHEKIVQGWQKRRESRSDKRSKDKDGNTIATTPKSSRRKSKREKDRDGSGRSTPKKSSSSSSTSTSESRYMLILVRALEILEQLTQSNPECADQLVKNNARSLDILVRIFGGVRRYATSWEGMLVLGRVAGVLLSVVALDDSGRRRFFEAKGGAALLLSVSSVGANGRVYKLVVSLVPSCCSNSPILQFSDSPIPGIDLLFF